MGTLPVQALIKPVHVVRLGGPSFFSASISSAEHALHFSGAPADVRGARCRPSHGFSSPPQPPTELCRWGCKGRCHAFCDDPRNRRANLYHVPSYVSQPGPPCTQVLGHAEPFCQGGSCQRLDTESEEEGVLDSPVMLVDLSSGEHPHDV